ncbi:MAG: c-type cytochrome domain-containing protein [Planctomycetaceae bacterium]
MSLLLLFGPFSGVSADEKSPSPGYYRNVRPILQRHCSGCHFPGKREGKLSVVSFADLLHGGEAGGGVIPGKPDDSTIVQYISGEEPEMPLNAEPLSPQDVDTIRRWIEAGAIDDTPASLGPEISESNPPVYRTAPVVTTMDYSPDGKWLAVSGYHEVLLHSLEADSAPRRLIGRSPRIESLSFSPDGQTLAVAGGAPSLFGEIQIWSVETGKQLHSTTISHDTLFGVSFNADGTLVAFGGADNSLRALKVETGEVVMQMDAHSDWVLGSTFSLANDHLISVSRDQSMKLTMVENGQFVDNITSITPGALKGGLVDVQRHPKNEEVLAVGADGEPRLYRIFRVQARKIGDDFNLIRAYPKLPGRLCDIDFSPGGTRFVCGSSTATGGAARIYQTDDPAKTIDLPEINGPAFAVSFRPDEKQVAVAGFDGQIRLFDSESGRLQKTFSSAPILEVSATALR